MKKYLFFDLDGTLADTDGDIRLAWKAALGDLGLECPGFDRDFVAGPPIEEMVRKLFPAQFSEELAAGVRARFGVHYDHDGFPTTREYPGVLDRVRELRAAGARVFIATNKRYAGASLMAAKFGWMDVFEALYTGDMLATAEPAERAARLSRAGLDTSIVKMRKPELLDFIMRELGADASECAMIGDTVNDFDAAARNGMESVAVAWGYGTPGERARATRIATVPADI